MNNTVLVTGAKGFIGKNLVQSLKEQKINVHEFDLDNSLSDLARMAHESEFVFHLAGVNRPKNDDEFKRGNADFTTDLLSILEENGKKIPILLSSSIQAELDNPYGKSKKASEEIVARYISEAKNGVIYRLHNVFGKWCRPNYNSVVATFCNNIANNLDIEINDPEKIMELVYVDDVVDGFISVYKNNYTSTEIQYINPVQSITLGKIAEQLYFFRDCLSGNFLPDLSSKISKNLFSTLLSYYPTDKICVNPTVNQDDRGFLFELIKSKTAGQVFISTTKPGITRGNHYHHSKIEKFCVIKGKAKISLRHIIDNVTKKFIVNGDEPKIIHIPPGYTHNITNTGKEDMIAVFWANEIFNKENPDTFYKEV